MPEKKFQRLRRAVIKEEYIAITGDMVEAVILNQMIYWSERVSDFDGFIAEEKQRQTREENNEGTMPLLHGWIRKSADELREEIMSSDSPKTIRRKLDDLVTKGFLDRRNNPKSQYDRKYQYRVNFARLLAALETLGYTLEGYRVDLTEQDNDSVPKTPVVREGNHVPDTSVPSKGQNVPSNGQNDQWKGHGVPAVLKTTVKTISKTISSPSYSPMQRDKPDDEDGEKELYMYLRKMKLEQLCHQDMVAPMKEALTGLWQTGKMGKACVSPGVIRKTFDALTPEILDGVIDRFVRQAQKEPISCPVEYIKALILNAPQNATWWRMASDEKETSRTPSYDIEEYIRLSMERLIGKKSVVG